ncbi:DMT family transporter [Oceaniradius stylonematis]|jgi:drug/metabolite transporter (DMT)-like permease|uniref:aromatic amino acid exporter YddG n=1 Tax=Oceaniradius stylonematis TaxID=2184161 RepID=UPI00273F6A82|nr:EamA family transporter [Oceaniradius stylonematis]
MDAASPTTRPASSRHRNLATLAGFLAVVMWGFLALLTDATGAMPPFQTAAISFAVGTLVGLLWHASRRGRQRLWPADGQWLAYGLGSIGLFGYHALYFAALKAAPAVEASLIAYLWPLLIVVGSALLPGERLRWYHMAGALLGFIGAALIVTRGTSLAVNPEFAGGYALAVAAAFTWASYSLVARRFAAVPSSAVIVFCAVAALLSTLGWWLLERETAVWPLDATQWLAVIGLGLLPVGAAFYVWDYGVKHGDIQLVGTSSYAAPLLSTLILIAAGRAEAGWAVLVACVLITAGALLAALSTIGRRTVP